MWFAILWILLILVRDFILDHIDEWTRTRQAGYGFRALESNDGEVFEVEHTFESASTEVEELLQSGPMLQRHIRSGTSLGVDETWNTLQEMQRQGKVQQRHDGMWELR